MILVYENGEIVDRENAHSSWQYVTSEAENAVKYNSLEILAWLKIVARRHHDGAVTDSSFSANFFGAAPAAAATSDDDDKGSALLLR